MTIHVIVRVPTEVVGVELYVILRHIGKIADAVIDCRILLRGLDYYTAIWKLVFAHFRSPSSFGPSVGFLVAKKAFAFLIAYSSVDCSRKFW